MRLKICDGHLTCKVANKCLDVRERVEVVEWNKMVPFLPLLSCELSVSVKENPDRKKKKKKICAETINCVKLSTKRNCIKSWYYFSWFTHCCSRTKSKHCLLKWGDANCKLRYVDLKNPSNLSFLRVWKKLFLTWKRFQFFPAGSLHFYLKQSIE